MTLYDLHPDAKIGQNVKISNFTTICEDVEIGDGTWIGPNVTIFPGARIGKNCRIFPGAVIAAVPQDLKFAGEYTTVEIGDNNTIRECCTINHVAHDCVIGDNCVLANNATLAGHIIMGDYVILGGKTACLQFIHIGSHVITQGGALIDKDVPPFIKAARYPIQYCGVNTLGLQRRGFTQESINRINDIYRYIFVKGLNVTDAIEQVKEHFGTTDEAKQILAFIGSANTGLLSGYKSVVKKA